MAKGKDRPTKEKKKPKKEKPKATGHCRAGRAGGRGAGQGRQVLTPLAAATGLVGGGRTCASRTSGPVRPAELLARVALEAAAPRRRRRLRAGQFHRAARPRALPPPPSSSASTRRTPCWRRPGSVSRAPDLRQGPDPPPWAPGAHAGPLARSSPTPPCNGCPTTPSLAAQRLFGWWPPAACWPCRCPTTSPSRSHRLMREVAASAPWAGTIGGSPPWRDGSAACSPSRPTYYDLLAPPRGRPRSTSGTPPTSTAWPTPAAIVDWVRATGLKPFVDPLGAAEAGGLPRPLPRRAGRGLSGRRPTAASCSPFPRLFLVAVALSIASVLMHHPADRRALDGER